MSGGTKTLLSVHVQQEYHTWKATFLPGVSVVNKTGQTLLLTSQGIAKNGKVQYLTLRGSASLYHVTP